jgi:hypothetical protein
MERSRDRTSLEADFSSTRDSGLVTTGAGAAGFFEDRVEDLAVVEVAGVLVVVAGRVAVDREGARDVRGVVRLVGASAADREVVAGLFAAPVLEVTVGLLSAAVAVVLRGDVVVVEEVKVDFRVDRLLVGFRFSSPEVIEDRSGSWSDAVDLDVPRAVRRAVVPGAGRVGGLFRLDPKTLERLDVVEGLDIVDVLAEVDVVAGRFAAAAADEVVNGRRGGAVPALEDATGEDIFFFGVVDVVFGAGAAG